MGGLVESEWLSYRTGVLPPDVGAVQLQETRRAFYAGARALVSGLLKRLAPGTEPTEEDLALLDQVEEELQQFGRDVAAGKA